MSHPARIEPGPGQESVWDYPRPPRVEEVSERIRVVFAGRVIADSTRALRVVETASPPTYYIPPEDIASDALQPVAGRGTWCEWKGRASYFDVVVGGRRAARAAWTYQSPEVGFEAIRDHVAFYAGKMERCTVGDEEVRPQAGDFYGGWITSRIVGPFKGDPGTGHW